MGEKMDIKEDDFNIEDIMNQVRENIKNRKEKGTSKEIEQFVDKDLPSIDKKICDDRSQCNIDYINSNWDINVKYSISSHRPIIGRLLIWGRKLIHGEVKRYIGPIIGKQSEFNMHIVRILNRIKDADSGDIDAKINNAIMAIDKSIDTKIREHVKKSLDEEQKDYINYFIFEEKFRGNTEEIKQRQSIFLEYFKDCKNILDIGCGRGEFLSLLKENGIGAKGIDIDEDMVLYCQKIGLNVEKIDALSYLKLLNNKSLDGIFSGQVIEHLQPAQLIGLIKLCYDKMKYGTYFVAETINPLCLSVFSTSFYMDLSHVRPIHPETIKFLLESAGFRDIQFKFFSPHTENERLDKLEIDGDIGDNEKRHIEIMNKNIDKLNSLLYGFKDYAVIAKK